MVFIAKVRREGKRGVHSPISCVEDETEGSPKEDDNALREAAREASRRKAMGEEPGEPVTLADIQRQRRRQTLSGTGKLRSGGDRDLAMDHPWKGLSP